MKRFKQWFLTSFLVLGLVISGVAQSQKISQLPSGNPAQSGDLIPIARDGSNYSVTPQSILGLGSASGIYASSYGVVGEGHFSTNIAVASEPTEIVTCIDCNFQTQAKVGQIFFASTLQGVGGSSMESATIITAANSTITSIDSNTQIHVSANIDTNCTAHSCTAVWGTDESTALSSASTAALAGCAPLILPGVSPEGGPAVILVSSGQFQGSSSSCPGAGGGATRSGMGVLGASTSGTYIVPTPAFDPATCVGGLSGTACFGGILDEGDYCCFTIFGGGNSEPGAGFNGKVGLEIDSANDAKMWDVNLLAWGSNSTKTDSLGVGLLVSGGEIDIYHLDLDGFGCVGEKLVGGSGSLGPVTQAGSDVFDTGCTGVYDNNANNEFFTVNSSYGGGNAIAPSTCINNGGQWHANGDSFGLASGYGGGALYNGYCYDVAGVHTGAGTAFLSGSSLYGNGDNFTLYANSTSNINHVQSSVVSGSSGIVTIQNNGLFFDDGGNRFIPNGGTIYSASGGTLFGSASITGIAQTSGNIALTNFGSSPSVGTVSGDSRVHQFTATVGSTPSGTATIVDTFPTPFLVAPICNATPTGGNNSTLGSFTTGTISATSVTFTYVGTLIGADTLVVQVNCF